MKSNIPRYEVKYEEGQECGGGYVKLLNAGSHDDLKAFNVNFIFHFF